MFVAETALDWWCIALICMTCFVGAIQLANILIDFAFWVGRKLNEKCKPTRKPRIAIRRPR